MPDNDTDSIRLSITLPPELHAAAQDEAKQKTISLAAVIRIALIDRYTQKLDEWRAQQAGRGGL